MRLSFLLWLSLTGMAVPVTAADTAPSAVFDLHAWKLQIPGPKEIKKLQGYASPYFFLTPEREMTFHLDAAEKGTTPNTHYVRSELRHLLNWKVGEKHQLNAEVRAVSHLQPDKLTVLQIHGIMEDGSDAPPLLRIALNKGDLMAMLKTGATGEENEGIKLVKKLGAKWAKVEVLVNEHQLTLRVNGETKLTRDLSYWKYPNYFKAGLYPQATSGTADVFFRSLEVK